MPQFNKITEGLILLQYFITICVPYNTTIKSFDLEVSQNGGQEVINELVNYSMCVKIKTKYLHCTVHVHAISIGAVNNKCGCGQY